MPAQTTPLLWNFSLTTAPTNGTLCTWPSGWPYLIMPKEESWSMGKQHFLLWPTFSLLRISLRKLRKHSPEGNILGTLKSGMFGVGKPTQLCISRENWPQRWRQRGWEIGREKRLCRNQEVCQLLTFPLYLQFMGL